MYCARIHVILKASCTLFISPVWLVAVLYISPYRWLQCHMTHISSCRFLQCYIFHRVVGCSAIRRIFHRVVFCSAMYFTGSLFCSAVCFTVSLAAVLYISPCRWLQCCVFAARSAVRSTVTSAALTSRQHPPTARTVSTCRKTSQSSKTKKQV